MPKNVNKRRIPAFSVAFSMADLCPEPIGFEIKKAVRYDKGVIVIEFDLHSDYQKTHYQVEILPKNSFLLQCLTEDPYKSWLKVWEVYASGKHNDHSVVEYKLDVDLNNQNLPSVLPENLLRATSAAIRYAITGSTNKLFGYLNTVSNA